MANYTTSCTANGGILNGSMTVDPATGDVSSYYSDTAGAGTVSNNNPSSSNLNFNVRFGTNQQRYPIIAVPDGNGGYRGNGGSNPMAEEEPWTATAVPVDDTPKANQD